MYKMIRMFYALAIQSVYFEICAKGLYDRPDKERHPFLWIIQTMYFFMCPTIFIIGIISILNCYKVNATSLAGSVIGDSITPKRALFVVRVSVVHLFVFNIAVCVLLQLVLYMIERESTGYEHFNIKVVAVSFIVIYGLLLILTAFMGSIFR